MKIKAAKYIAKFFVDNDIKDCFMVTGGGAMHLDDAIGHEPEIKCTFNHHEQACTIAAESYAKLTGKIALVCVTSGPGGTNAITGVMGGWVDSIPMFIISGQVKRETTTYSCSDLNLRQLGDQEFNIINSVSNMTKYAKMITTPNEIAYHLEKALFLAKTGRPGPVWLDIPLDIQGAMIDTDELLHFDPDQESFWPVLEPSESVIDLLVDKIKVSKAPLILAGMGINLSGARDKFLAFLNKYKIPAVTAWNSNDILAFDNDYFVGMPGTLGTRAGNFAVQNCDLLINLGCRMNLRMIGYTHFDFAKNAFKTAIDIDPRELFKPTLRLDLPINSDVSKFLDKMLSHEYEPQETHKNWLDWCKKLLNKYPAVRPEFYSNGEKLINPYVFIDKLFASLDSNDKIICGNGSACVITFQAGKVKQGQRLYTNSGCAAMGYGLPAAIGAAVAAKNSRIICIDGEGSIMMNLQELATVKYNALDLKIFVLNNNGYLSIRQTQRNLFEPPFIGIDSTSGICFPDFAKLADSFGLKYFRLDNELTAEKIINDVLTCESACICETVVDPEQNFEPKSSSKILPDGRIISPSLDDMSPFLPREEFNKIRYLV